MKKFYTLLVLLSTLTYSQDKTEADKKIREGIALHDSGKYEEAISKYDEALGLDKDNALALTEKAMTLEAYKKYDAAIELCKRILKLHPKEDNKTVYITYGNSLDHSGKSGAALKIYDEGIVKYPNYYQLYFNKGITLFNAKESEKATQAFQTATKLNPNHTSSFNALAVLNSANRIPSILASSRYLALDNKSPRAKGHVDIIVSQMKKGVSKTGDTSISLSIEEETLDKANKNKKTDDNFSSVDLVLSMSAALDYDEKNKDKTEIQKFADKFSTMCQVMAEVKKNQKGYYWEFLAPYFIEMDAENLVEPFAHIIYLSYQSKEAMEYREKHSDRIAAFYNWSKNYNWK